MEGYLGGGRGGVGMEVIESIDDLSVFCDKITINSTQKISSRVLNSRNMMSGGGSFVFTLSFTEIILFDIF